MAKNSKPFKSTAEYQRTKQLNKEARKHYKLQQKESAQIRKHNERIEKIKTEREKFASTKGRPATIKAVGEAASQVVTPLATTHGATKVSADVTAMKAWNSILGGNPNPEKGDDGQSQGKSTTKTTSGGSMFGG